MTRPDRPMWCDGFDADLPRVLPEAREIVGDLADVVLWTTGHLTDGVLNHPDVWNGHRTMVAFFGFACVRRPAGYACSGAAVRCMAWEVLRDAWLHSYTILVELRPVWDTLALRPELETLIAEVRGWPIHGRDPDAARRLVRGSLTRAVARFRHLVATHPDSVQRMNPTVQGAAAR